MAHVMFIILCSSAAALAQNTSDSVVLSEVYDDIVKWPLPVNGEHHYILVEINSQ